MQTFVLPNGLKIYAQSEIGASALYHEIFNSKTYLQHGIEVSDGDCVFDVGANVGLFSIFLSQSYGGLRLFAFEPIRQTFSLLEKNVGLHLNGSHAKLFNFGLSSRSGIVPLAHSQDVGGPLGRTVTDVAIIRKHQP